MATRTCFVCRRAFGARAGGRHDAHPAGVAEAQAFSRHRDRQRRLAVGLGRGDHGCLRVRLRAPFGFYSKLTARYRTSPEKYELFADTGESADSDAGSVQQTAVSKAFAKAGKKMLFVFDYGDEWRFTVELVKLGEKKPGTRYPRLLDSSGDAPEQYPDMD